jgi:NhaP-type Na+/H+ and K+/H+ antiporter
MVIGEAGFGIRFDDAELTRTLGFCALIVIIAEGRADRPLEHAAAGARAVRACWPRSAWR